MILPQELLNIKIGSWRWIHQQKLLDLQEIHKPIARHLSSDMHQNVNVGRAWVHIVICESKNSQVELFL